MDSNETISVSDNSAMSRYEVHVDGGLAGFAEYVRSGRRINFPHTVVEQQFGGRGFAGRMAAKALDAARAEQLLVSPQCSFFERYIATHPEYQDIVDPQFRTAAGGAN